MRQLRSLGFAATVILVAASRAAALTPTPTPTPITVVHASPQLARSGQSVTLSANRSPGGSLPHWAQIAGPPVVLADADTLEATFVAPAVASRATFGFRFSMPPYPDTLDLEVAVVPADAVAVAIDTDVPGPSGGLTEIGVSVDPLGLTLASLRHEIAYTREAAVADRGDGTPDCDAAAGIATGTFAFLPAGCAPDSTCTGVRADLTFATPPAGAITAYRCRIVIAYVPTESCTHALTCAGGDATSGAGEALQLACTDGSVIAHFPDNPAQFSVQVAPEYIQVGVPVQLTYTVVVPGGLAQYDLWGLDPWFTDIDPSPDLSTGDVVYTLHPARAGNALLQLYVNFETTGGCPGNEYYYFTYATSPTLPLTIHDPGGVRISGRVAEFPGCQGAMRNIEVILQPGDRVTRTDLSDGTFAFDGVSPGDYAVIVSPECNPYGCWPTTALHVVANQDRSLTLCPLTSACVGDCSGDRRVTIDELVRGVDMALGNALVSACAALDSDASGSVQIEELITAVNAALEGCSGVNNTTPTPTPTPAL